MTKLSDLRKKEVISSDGHIIGTVHSAIITQERTIFGLTIKIKKKMAQTLEKKKPLLSPLLLDVKIDEITGVRDKVVLHHPLKELGTQLLPHNTKFDAERLLGVDVLGREGKVVGSVEDMEIDTLIWTVPTLLIKVKKDALETIKKDKCVLCGSQLHISMHHVIDIGDYVMLEMTAENIGQILSNISMR
ncbi:MAG: PRC-barrel domain-containing protein [Candidatus Thermoplasmatota archaeon]|nr:PRC-barrel domain-containing protein [Candidatus Thermoplasmatota archaeon]